MMTDYMKLTTRRDAYIWAENMSSDLSEEQIKTLAAWIWENKPAPDCTYAEHPISTIGSDAFYAIIGE